MRQKLLSFLFFVSFIFISRANNVNINSLIQDSGWERIHSFDDSVQVYEKHLQHLNLKAYRVLKRTNINAGTLFSVFESIDKYENVLKSAQNIDFETLEFEGDTIYGYQHINIPIVKDRHYVYQMVKNSVNSEFAYWILQDEGVKFKEFIEKKSASKNNPIYLDEGTGVFKVVPNSDRTNIVSYSLYMDPGGNLPNFLINMINERGLVNMFRDVIDEANRMEKENSNEN